METIRSPPVVLLLRELAEDARHPGAALGVERGGAAADGVGAAQAACGGHHLRPACHAVARLPPHQLAAAPDLADVARVGAADDVAGGDGHAAPVVESQRDV